MTITEWVPGEAMGVRHTGVVTGTGRFTLVETENGQTLFTWTEDLSFPWWLGGKLGEIVGGKVVMRFIWRRNLVALKKLVESA